jgi:hypothetical protein
LNLSQTQCEGVDRYILESAKHFPFSQQGFSD